MKSKNTTKILVLLIFLSGFFMACITQNQKEELQRWSTEKANSWYDQYPFLVGGNYVPASAINQLEMWQAETFDPQRIDFELRRAAEIGMNTMRVFLHDLAWKQDKNGFFNRVDQFLTIADKHGIKPMFVIFDGVWNPFPKTGKQPKPVPHVHNSGWVQSPGKEILADSKKQDELKEYVQAIISRYKNDDRVLAWDLFNEADNANGSYFGSDSKSPDLPLQDKMDKALELLEKSFLWAREINPSQPLTVCVWKEPTYLETPDKIEKFSLENSDVISFHSYSKSRTVLPLFHSMYLRMKKRN